MNIIVIGYIRDFKLPNYLNQNDVNIKIIEGVSERIDYIRSNNLEKEETFTLIPRFVTNISDSGKQIMIFIQKIDILSNIRKRRKLIKFGQVQSRPFFDSRQIIVTTQKLKDIFPIDTLIINWGSIVDTLGYLKSAETKIYDISKILIHKDIELENSIITFLKEHYFYQDYSDSDYNIFSNNKPNIKSLIFKEPSDILDYFNSEIDKHEIDIMAINCNNNIHLPFSKFYPCKDSVLYLNKETHSERIKNTVIFGNVSTMIRLANLLKNKRIIFLESLKTEGFLIHEF